MINQQRVFIVEAIERARLAGDDDIWDQDRAVIAAFSTMELAEQWVENNFEEIDEDDHQLHAEIRELVIDLYVEDGNI